jgi:signal transduction histidine kinase
MDCSDELILCADNSMFETVLRNLLSNAIKFTPRNGEINIKCYPDADSNSTVIEVSDTGVGMTADVLEKVFDVSSKHHTPGTENEASSGLGLVLVKEFVERNSGLLQFESESGIGTTFRCTFPAHMQVDL